MNRIEFLQTLDSLERLIRWAEEAESVSEGSWLLAQNILNSLTAFGLMHGFIDHETLCPRCGLAHLESEFDSE